MIEEFTARLSTLDKAILAPKVALALGVDEVEIEQWTFRPLSGGMAAWAGVYGNHRLEGTARTPLGSQEWMLVLKVYGSVSQANGIEPESWTYWKREALFYKSGVLQDLSSGISAPVCYGVDEVSDDEVWIWMEYVPDQSSHLWSPQQYHAAAMRLGVFNGSNAGGFAVTAQSWWATGWQCRSAFSEGIYQSLADLRAYARRPGIEGMPSAAEVDVWEMVLEKRSRLLDALGQLPRSFCHHDPFRRNLLVSKDAAGADRLVAIDWAQAGMGALGEDPAQLQMVSLTFLDYPVADADRLGEAIFDGYLVGLRTAGWQGDARLVRLGFAIASLFGGVEALALEIFFADSATRDASQEEIFDRPITEIKRQRAEAIRFAFRYGVEALALLDELRL